MHLLYAIAVLTNTQEETLLIKLDFRVLYNAPPNYSRWRLMVLRHSGWPIVAGGSKIWWLVD